MEKKCSEISAEHISKRTHKTTGINLRLTIETVNEQINTRKNLLMLIYYFETNRATTTTYTPQSLKYATIYTSHYSINFRSLFKQTVMTCHDCHRCVTRFDFSISAFILLLEICQSSSILEDLRGQSNHALSWGNKETFFFLF